MHKIDIQNICKEVLNKISCLENEKDGAKGSNEQLIFPKTSEDNIRISEQELRLLFIQVFKELYKNYYYSVETPTKEKYSFGEFEEIKFGKGKSASVDMTVFEKDSTNYNRILNIEFKHGNVKIKNFAKDVLKLVHEEPAGAFIIMLDNIDKGTLNNVHLNSNPTKLGTGVLDKLYHSFVKFKDQWSNDNKSIEIVVISLAKKQMLYCLIENNNESLRGLDCLSEQYLYERIYEKL